MPSENLVTEPVIKKDRVAKEAQMNKNLRGKKDAYNAQMSQKNSADYQTSGPSSYSVPMMVESDKGHEEGRMEEPKPPDPEASFCPIDVNQEGKAKESDISSPVVGMESVTIPSDAS